MITGVFAHSLDEKGRLMIPARLRSEIDDNVMILTRSVDRCLWLFPISEWELFSASVIGSMSSLTETARLIQRRIIAPAQEAEIDRAGRFVIPQTLREFAGLKKECRILGMLKFIEIWEADAYQEYLAQNEDKFKEAAEELGRKLTL